MGGVGIGVVFTIIKAKHSFIEIGGVGIGIVFTILIYINSKT